MGVDSRDNKGKALTALGSMFRVDELNAPQRYALSPAARAPTPHHKIYFGGDSGYGPHFKAIGKKFGSFDYAILECGQYDPDWSLIHMSPEETASAAHDLNSKTLIPSHNSKFKLANHAWNDPLNRISKASAHQSYRLATPMIGEKIEADNSKQVFSAWWE